MALPPRIARLEHPGAIVSPRVWPYLVVAGLGGVLVAFSGIHRYHNSDSLVPILVSVQHWTWFFWEQDRYGMLVPLLATPFPHPLTNLLVQTTLTAASGIASIYLIARYLVRGDTWPIVGSTAVVMFLLVASPRFLWMYLSTWNPPAPALALAFASLALVGPCEGSPRGRWLLAIPTMLLATWVNASVGPFVFVLALCLGGLRWCSDREHRSQYRRELVIALAIATIGTLAAFVEQDLSEFQGTTVMFPPLADLRFRILRGPIDLWSDLTPKLWSVALGACLCGSAALLERRRTRPTSRNSLAVLVAVAVAGLLFAFVMAFASMGYWRYAIPTMIMLHVAAVAAIVRPLTSLVAPASLRILNHTMAAVVIAAIPLALGFSSISSIRQDLDVMEGRPEGVNSASSPYPSGGRETPGARADEVLAGRCTHITGGSWKMGPVVFLANLKRADRGEPATLWGLSLRSQATAVKWKAVPRTEVRVGVFPSDKEGPIGLRDLGFPLHEAERIGSMQVYLASDP